MHQFFNWINRIHLLYALVVLAAGHLLLYYTLGTRNWLVLALSAALIDTGILAALQVIGARYSQSRGR